MTTVLDASFAVAITTSRPSVVPIEVVELMVADGLQTPAIFWHETASALRGAWLRGLIDGDFRDLALGRLRLMNIELDHLNANIGPVVRASERFQLTIYDAAYLELAMRTGAKLATFDKALIAAAPRAGVRLAP